MLKKNWGMFIGVLLFAALVQIVFFMFDGKDSPEKAVVEFTRAYFKLDYSMSKRVCDNLNTIDDIDIISRYIDKNRIESEKRGYSINIMKSSLYNINTSIIEENNDTAVVRIHGKKRMAINPVYKYIAQMFNLGRADVVDEQIEVIKKDNRWYVCGKPFSLIEGGLGLAQK